MPRVGTAPRILQPYWSTVDRRLVRLYHGHVVDVLKRLPEESVHCVTTSPPYWGLRDYGTGTWEGGDPNCGHIERKGQTTKESSTLRGGKLYDGEKMLEIETQFKSLCGKCGAKRTDQQLGSEPSPDCGTNGKAQCGRCFVCTMVEVFREVYRVLRDDGTLWLNLGDTYNAPGLPGNLVGVPWRVALALQANGWILRQDIIWHKPSPMPESVRNRCTKAHEYVFLFAKRSGYFYDAEAVREEEKNPGASAKQIEYQKRKAGTKLKPVGVNHSLEWFTPESERDSYKGGRNKRSVWTVSPQGYEGAHFATYPPKLIEPMIKAGTSEKGCCSECGAPWKRIVNVGEYTNQNPTKRKAREDNPHKQGDTGINNVGGGHWPTKTIGWEPTCECNGKFVERKKTVKGTPPNGVPRGWAVGEGSHNVMDAATSEGRKSAAEREARQTKVAATERLITVREYVSELPLEDHPVIPCTVLDPFIGSGTTCDVSLGLGRRSIGIDLSKDYLDNNAIPRIEGALMSRPNLAALVPREVERMDMGEEL